MQLLVIGLNHNTAPLEFREKFNLDRHQVKHLLHFCRYSDVINEIAILSTCNRTEIYLTTDHPMEGMAKIKAVIEKVTKSDFHSDYFYVLTGENCVRHLFYVSSSLDSLVVGEGQILSQVKDAYHLARTDGTTSTLLNTIFNQAISTGKKVRTKTMIAYRSVSVSSAAVDLAMDVIGGLEDANILVIGAGKMSELTARHLLDKGAKSIFVTNRNYQHAVDLAEKYGGSVIKFDNFLEQAVDTDIIITSTGAPHYIIRSDQLEEVLKKRTKKTPLVIIDIAVPRDVDPEVAGLRNAVLYNLDDLKNVVEVNKGLRNQETAQAKEIIEEDITDLKDHLSYLSLRPVMVRLHDKFDFLRTRILAKTLRKMPDLTEDQRHKIDIMSQKLLFKFLRDPMICMNTAAGTEDEEKCRESITKLFRLKAEDEDELGDEKTYDYWD